MKNYKEFFNSWIFKLPFMKDYAGICLGRFVFYADAEEKVSWTTRNHENIHQQQMDIEGVIPFYLKYLYFYIRLYLRGFDKDKVPRFKSRHDFAYFKNPFELEAYLNQFSKEYKVTAKKELK